MVQYKKDDAPDPGNTNDSNTTLTGNGNFKIDGNSHSITTICMNASYSDTTYYIMGGSATGDSDVSMFVMFKVRDPLKTVHTTSI